MNAALQAERYFETLYGVDPPGLIGLSFAERANGKLKFGPTECVSTAADAAARVVGVVDVFTRVGLLREQPPDGRRGTESLTSALPGVWVEFDVNGAPDGRGGIVEDGFSTAEAAIEFAKSVATPTMLVRSGYGIHAYWLFPKPWMLEGNGARMEAKDLEHEWLMLLHQHAKAQGISKLDHVHDLTRVLRPPSSANGKDTSPAPVTLLDADGPRYTVEQIRQHLQIEPEPEPEPEPAPEPDRVTTGNVWVERHPSLEKVARRKGKAPGNGTPSEWDFYLGCKAAEAGATDEDLAELLRYARSLHPDDNRKGERDDYIARTVAAVRNRVGSVGGNESVVDRLARLTEISRAESVGLRVVGATVAGHGSTAQAELHFEGKEREYTIHFERFDQVAMPTKLGDQLATTIGVALPDLSRQQARRFAADMRELSSREHEYTESDLMVGAALEFLDAIEIRDFDWESQAERAALFLKMKRNTPVVVDPSDHRGLAESMLAARASTGELIVQTRDVHTYMRRRATLWTPGKVHATLLRAGWRYPNTQGRMKATPIGGKSFYLIAFIVPAGWAER